VKQLSAIYKSQFSPRF